MLFIANINTADDYELLTNLQKEDMIIIAEKYQYDIYRKIGIGIISPKDGSRPRQVLMKKEDLLHNSDNMEEN